MTAQMSGPAANTDTQAPDDDRSVRPLWMITVGLAGFFAAMALALALG